MPVLIAGPQDPASDLYTLGLDRYFINLRALKGGWADLTYGGPFIPCGLSLPNPLRWG